jgi:uncharacterized membrane protein
MDWGEFAAQWLHLLFGIFWFGSVLFADFILVPAIMTQPSERQVHMINAVAGRGDRIIVWVAILAIVSGIVRGTIYGPIKDGAALGTEYGIYWIIGLVAALATFAWGYMGSRQRARFAEQAVDYPGAGTMPADLSAQVGRIRIAALIELVGFAVIFTSMVLMHFSAEI